MYSNLCPVTKDIRTHYLSGLWGKGLSCNIAAVLRLKLLWENKGKGLQGLKKSFTEPSILLIDRLANLWPFYPVVGDQKDHGGGLGEE